MMRVVAMIAADVDKGSACSLQPGDRAAVRWGVDLAGDGCEVLFPAGDRTAWTYAAAVGAACVAWDERVLPSASLVLIGPGAIDRYGDELAGRLAEQLRAELLFDGLSLERQHSGWKIVCAAGHGAQDIVHVAGPVVLVVSGQVERPPYVSRWRLQQASRRIPTDLLETHSSTTWQSVTPRPPRPAGAATAAAELRANSAFGIESQPGRSREQPVIADEPAVCAQVLLRYLVHHGFVSRSVPEIGGSLQAGRKDDRPPAPAAAALSAPVLEAPREGRRGPRSPGLDPGRLARRPRRLASPVAGRTASSPVQRRPRPAGGACGQRGPFRLSSDGLRLPAETRAGIAAVPRESTQAAGDCHD